MLLLRFCAQRTHRPVFWGERPSELGKHPLELYDLFLAGSETTPTTLTRALLFMARYPEVQKKVQDELYAVVGLGLPPSLMEKPKLPYTEAVLMEIPDPALRKHCPQHGQPL